MNDPEFGQSYKAPVYGPGYGPAYAAYPMPTSSLSIASLVSGIMAWVFLPFLGAILAIILGHMALGEIRRSGERLAGRGMAVIGLVLGYVQMVLVVLILLIVIVAVALGIGIARQSAKQQAELRVEVKSGAVNDRVVAIVSEQFNKPKSEITPQTRLDDLKADDLDRVELVMELEDAFEIAIPDDDAERFRTVGDIQRYIGEKAAKGGKHDFGAQRKVRHDGPEMPRPKIIIHSEESGNTPEKVEVKVAP